MSTVLVTPAPRVLLLYPEGDKDLAAEFSEQLRIRGADVSGGTLRPGDPTATSVVADMRRADIVLVLVTPTCPATAWLDDGCEPLLASPDFTKVVVVLVSGATLPAPLAKAFSLDTDRQSLGATADDVVRAKQSAAAAIDRQLSEQIADLLSRLDVTWQGEPTLAGVRPDFLVEGPTGRRLVIEVKDSAPNIVALVEARDKAAHLRALTNADYGVVVVPNLGPFVLPVGVVALADLSRYVRATVARGRTRSRPEGEASATPRHPSAAASSRTVFAAMPFSSEYSDVYWVAMTAAASSIGAACIRVDRDDFNGDITARIKELIARSVAVIADMSTSNPNVLYEVGYAHGLGLPCVAVCSTPLEQLPFDVRNDNTLPYQPGQTWELRGPLTARLRAVLRE